MDHSREKGTITNYSKGVFSFFPSSLHWKTQAFLGHNIERKKEVVIAENKVLDDKLTASMKKEVCHLCQL